MPEVEGDELVDVVICDFALIDFRQCSPLLSFLFMLWFLRPLKEALGEE